jgi:hypothetical protein
VSRPHHHHPARAARREPAFEPSEIDWAEYHEMFDRIEPVSDYLTRFNEERNDDSKVPA